MVMVNGEEFGVYHVLIVLPEDAQETLVGSDEGDERDVLCLEEDDYEHCSLLAVSCVVGARQRDEVDEVALSMAGGYGVERPVTTVITDISDHAGQLQERGDISRHLQPGVLFEGECLFAVSTDDEVIRRAAAFAIEAFMSPEAE